MRETVLVLDFGSQYTQLIARRVREQNVYSEIRPYNTPIDQIRELNPKALILSGGPASVWDTDPPLISQDIVQLDIPILGICYGMQLLMHLLGGVVERSDKREFGPSELFITAQKALLFDDIPSNTSVWMSHSDKVLELPGEFVVIAKSDNSPIAAIKHREKPIYCTQFHPEVVHTKYGSQIISNFVHKIAGCTKSWSPEMFATSTIEAIKNQVGDASAVCALSGGVDSAVAALIMQRAIWDKLHCVFVDTGMMRLNEAKEVVKSFRDMGFNLRHVDAKDRFLKKLHGVSDPEQKRKIIGNEFIGIFEEEASTIDNAEFLVQGTLYPDVIESVSVKGPSATIKTHHNVGGLPEKMNLKLVEPLRELFKDEVRAVGRELGLVPEILNRHPFPGPGLAIRILGEIDEATLDTLRLADHIFIEEIRKAGIYDEIWQAFCVFLPVQSVGVMGDERTYENAIAVRAVTSVDGMTAGWAKIPYDVLEKISVRIINEVAGINRVVYDISTKPPSTIEWE